MRIRRRCKENEKPQIQRKCFQNLPLAEDLHPQYIKNSYDVIRRKLDWKSGQNTSSKKKVRNASQHRKTCFVRRRKGEPTVRSAVYLWDWLELRTPGKNSERLEPSHVPRGRQNGLAALETGLAISRNVPRTLSTQSNSPTHRCFPEKK